jgi:hypothetical protein
MCLQVDMAPKKKYTPLLREDFWTPIDRTSIVWPVVRLDKTTQDSQEILGGEDFFFFFYSLGGGDYYIPAAAPYMYYPTRSITLV